MDCLVELVTREKEKGMESKTVRISKGGKVHEEVPNGAVTSCGKGTEGGWPAVGCAIDCTPCLKAIAKREKDAVHFANIAKGMRMVQGREAVKVEACDECAWTDGHEHNCPVMVQQRIEEQEVVPVGPNRAAWYALCGVASGEADANRLRDAADAADAVRGWECSAAKSAMRDEAWYGDALAHYGTELAKSHDEGNCDVCGGRVMWGDCARGHRGSAQTAEVATPVEIKMDIVEVNGLRVQGIKVMGILPATVADSDFNLYVRWTEGVVRVDRSDTDEIITATNVRGHKVEAFRYLMQKLADLYGLPVVVARDPGVSGGQSGGLLGRWEPAVITAVPAEVHHILTSTFKGSESKSLCGQWVRPFTAPKGARACGDCKSAMEAEKAAAHTCNGYHYVTGCAACERLAPVACGLCAFRTDTEGVLTLHLESEHSMCPNGDCGQCDTCAKESQYSDQPEPWGDVIESDVSGLVSAEVHVAEHGHGVRANRWHARRKPSKRRGC